MNHWSFIIASYAFVLLGTALVVTHSYLAMRKAEAKAEQLSKRK
ncbi:hypothetical protein [uncultured Parasphingorhabdus sp.]|nr:hypothetical protein [uncultured Parasphingorhabdus sp.]